MTQKSIASIALAALVLGALPAAADHRDRDRGDERTAQLARELQHATGHLYSRAAVRGPYRGWAQWRAALALRSLDHRARDFRAGIDRYGADHQRTQREFRELEQAFARARNGARGLRHLRDDFERVSHLVRALDQRLASRADYRPDGRGPRGRDDRRRDDHPRDRYDRVALFSLSFGSR